MSMFRDKLKICEAAALIALCVALCTGTWAQGRQQQLSERLVRLHVLAHSDDAEEQRIKLRVRDAVLAYLEPGLESTSTSREAEQLIKDNIDNIAKAARRVSQGREVEVSFGTESYPPREYEAFALPAGEYRSLRVTLGEGQGQNWWCVVFPKLCMPAVGEDVSSVAVDAGFSDSLIGTISGEKEYQVRFFLLDCLGKLENFFHFR